MYMHMYTYNVTDIEMAIMSSLAVRGWGMGERRHIQKYTYL